jgi:hypothetical protein
MKEKIYTTKIEDGYLYYYKSGLLHREDGPAKSHCCGDKFWYWEGMHHRIKNPATILASNYKAWWKYDQRHRLNAPAVIHAYCDEKEYWIFNKRQD